MVELAFANLSGEDYRGWSVATPEGLFLMNVFYPDQEAPDVAISCPDMLCHPDGHDVQV